MYFMSTHIIDLPVSLSQCLCTYLFLLFCLIQKEPNARPKEAKIRAKKNTHACPKEAKNMHCTWNQISTCQNCQYLQEKMYISIVTKENTCRPHHQYSTYSYRVKRTHLSPSLSLELVVSLSDVNTSVTTHTHTQQLDRWCPGGGGGVEGRKALNAGTKAGQRVSYIHAGESI